MFYHLSSQRRLRWEITFALVGLCFLSFNYANESASTDSSSCASKETCSSCIQTNGCGWCSKPSWTNRCMQYNANASAGGVESLLGEERCPDKYFYYPQSNQTILENRPFRGAPKVGEPNQQEAVQIRPQKVKMQLRVREPISLDLHYALADGYPVDLYYLMDLSNSMKDDQIKLSKLGDTLVEEMKNLTSNFKIGFGSFVDKIAMPFVDRAALESTCDPRSQNHCSRPYGFINNMPLSDQTKKFKEEVMNATVSGNADAPEGGLDALMQVIVCNKEIGWREKARHIIILSTDESFHMAGDGKLAGILKPNDCLCHLKNSMYTHGLLMDYPSISQINRVADENHMTIIFAVVEAQELVYVELSKRITGSITGKLTQDSSNIVVLIKELYSKLVQSVKISDNAGEIIGTKYFSKCLEIQGSENQRSECQDLRVGDKIQFRAEIEVLKCPKSKAERHQKLIISPQGINEAVEVEIDIICDCPCEKPGSEGYEDNSPSCNKRGIFQCGICKCNKGYIGKNCECDDAPMSGSNNDEAPCIQPGNGTDDVKCSGQGECRCGVCNCKKRSDPKEIISGKYCECDNYSCKKNGGKLCSGQGACICGKCECLPGWTGDACDCLISNDKCIDPASQGNENIEICSGNGNCHCGKCICKDDGENRFGGTYCQDCLTCRVKCAELGPCVECHVFGSSLSPMVDTKEKCEQCNVSIEIVNFLPKDSSSNREMSRYGDIRNENGEIEHCSLPDHADCTYFFDYWYDKGSMSIHVRASRAKECAPPVDVLGIVAGVIGSIVAAGLVLLLIWKLLTDLHDRREFAKFEKERQNAKWDRGENPLYQNATTSFSNPTFGKG